MYSLNLPKLENWYAKESYFSPRKQYTRGLREFGDYGLEYESILAHDNLVVWHLFDLIIWIHIWLGSRMKSTEFWRELKVILAKFKHTWIFLKVCSYLREESTESIISVNWKSFELKMIQSRLRLKYDPI